MSEPEIQSIPDDDPNQPIETLIKEGHEAWSLPDSCREAIKRITTEVDAINRPVESRFRRIATVGVIAATAASVIAIAAWRRDEAPPRERKTSNSLAPSIASQPPSANRTTPVYGIPESVIEVDGHLAVSLPTPHPRIEVVRAIPLLSDQPLATTDEPSRYSTNEDEGES